MPNRVANPPAATQENLDLKKFQTGRKYHDKDLYELNSLQVVILKSLLSRLALGSNVQKHANAKLAVHALAFCFRKAGRRAGRLEDKQASRFTSKHTGRLTDKQEINSQRQSGQRKKAKHGKQGGPKEQLPHSHM